jgi:hypothetical protein
MDCDTGNVFARMDGLKGEGNMAPLPAHIQGDEKKLVAKGANAKGTTHTFTIFKDGLN